MASLLIISREYYPNLSIAPFLSSRPSWIIFRTAPDGMSGAQGYYSKFQSA